MHPVIDSVVFKTHDRFRVSVERVDRTIACIWPKKDNLPSTAFVLCELNDGTRQNEELLRQMARSIYLRCHRLQIAEIGTIAPLVNEYYQILKLMVPE